MLLNLPKYWEYFANSARCQAPQRKAKGTKGSNSAPSPAEAATPDAAPESCPLPFDTLLQSLPELKGSIGEGPNHSNHFEPFELFEFFQNRNFPEFFP